MSTFKITYVSKKGQQKVKYKDFEDWEGYAGGDGKPCGPRLRISALEWADDYASSLSNDYTIGVVDGYEEES